jgi:hypothetical protein
VPEHTVTSCGIMVDMKQRSVRLCAAADEEEAWIDLDTVQGYRRTVMCEAVREEVASNLGEAPGTCSQLLTGMIQRRLMPTPWLNQVCCLHN